MIRPAAEQDLPRILAIYDTARQFMRKSGNMVQWINGYPSEPLLWQDIAAENLYVTADESSIYGVFAFIMGEDPTYAHIDVRGGIPPRHTVPSTASAVTAPIGVCCTNA